MYIPICDICAERLVDENNNETNYHVVYSDYKENGIVDHSGKRYEICNECFEKIINFVDGMR